MQALIYSADQQMQYSTVDPPQPQVDEVLLKILYCGICGSDRHAYHGKDPRRRPPLILGHEAVGEDEAGARYIINPLITCRHCSACLSGRANLCRTREIISMARPGAFADYLAIPRVNLLPLPAGLTPAAAALSEPAACAWHLVTLAATRLPYSLASAHGLVLGAGAIGILSALTLAICGCRRVLICDTQPARCAACEQIGLSAALVEDLPVDEYDIVIDAVGAAATRRCASAAAAPGGVIAHIGLEDSDEGLDVRRLTLQEINFTATYTYTPAEFAATVALLADNAFGDVMQFSSVRPLAEGAQAFAELDSGAAPAKILLQP